MAVRPYYMMFRGEPRIVDAGSAAIAVQHVVQDQITELRPARANEVSAWVRGGKTIEVAGEKVAQAAQTSDSNDAVVRGEPADFNFDDARAWVADMQAVEGANRADALIVFDKAKAEDRLTLMAFDEIRAIIPDFATAMLVGPHAEAIEPTIDDVRARLEEQPLAFDVVIAKLQRHFTFYQFDDGVPIEQLKPAAAPVME